MSRVKRDSQVLLEHWGDAVWGDSNDSIPDIGEHQRVYSVLDTIDNNCRTVWISNVNQSRIKAISYALYLSITNGNDGAFAIVTESNIDLIDFLRQSRALDSNDIATILT